MKKNLVHQLEIILFCLLIIIPGSSFSAELLYSLAAGQNKALRADSSAVAVQVILSSPEQLTRQTEFMFPLPNGELVSGTVRRILEGRGPSELEQYADSVTVITLKDNGGALRMIEENGTLSGMILFDNSEQKIYQAALDDTGSGVLTEDDPNKYLCVHFPVHDAEPVPAEMLSVAEQSPDLSVLRNLESRPGASNTLYINFWGGTLSGTVWNDTFNNGLDIHYSPYSRDIDSNSFSATDRYNIWLAWLEAAEDYAPFDINVTSSEAVYLATPSTNRVQIIATTTDYFLPDAGGVAYLDAFQAAGDYYRTGWAWNSTAGSLGITISHEAGHQMGLSHDGTLTVEYYEGHGDWGPIMGAPYDQPYVQWDRGEYFGANNQEDDLSIISGVLGSVADDAGNFMFAATALTLPVTGYEGLITPDGIFSDIDVYSFEASGSTHIEVTPLLGDEGENRASNLAMNITLEHAAGLALAGMSSADNSPLAPNSNTFVYDGTLLSGTYYLTVEAVSPDSNWFTGFGEYGNGGRYRMSVSSGGNSSAPDLIIVSPSVSDNTLTPNQFFTLSATVKNQGTGTASFASLRYYRSTDATISTNDSSVGIDALSSLAAGATSEQNISITAPSSGAIYWFGACVTAVIGESDTSNQCSQGVQITVIRPDLTVIAPSVSNSSPTPGQSFTATASVKNQGTAPANSSTLRYYRSSDASITVFDTLLSSDFIAALTAGESSPQNASLTAPSSEGSYWIGACVSTVSDESDTNNQCSSGVRITVGQKQDFPWLLFYPAFL